MEVVLALGVTGFAATVSSLVAPESRAVAVLAALMVVGEMLPVHLRRGREVPLSYALVPPLARVAGGPVAVVAVVASLAVGAATRTTPLAERAVTAIRRIVVATAGLGSYHLTVAADGVHGVSGGTLGVVVPLAVAALTIVVLDGLLHRVGLHRSGSSIGAELDSVSAWFAVTASGVLMGLAHAGVDGNGRMGAWGIALFAVPLLAVRYAFARLHAIALTHDQTVRVLSVVPELGGRTRPGQAEQLAAVATAMGRFLGLSPRALADLERAALLHALGHVTFDDPDVRSDPIGIDDVVRATSDMLAGDDTLIGPARIVAAAAGVGPVDVSEDVQVAARILDLAARYAQEWAGSPFDARRALEVVRSGRARVDDAEVVEALERLVDDRLASV